MKTAMEMRRSMFIIALDFFEKINGFEEESETDDTGQQ
jgi:hypothetical protein